MYTHMPIHVPGYFLQKYDLLFFILHWEELVHLCSDLLITVNNVTDMGHFTREIIKEVLMYDMPK